VTTDTLHAERAIAGYTLLERIGAGGYGEVWKARGPGGLTKAVKYVYGRLEDQRAICEQKALERIKEVRHPFLLSLERVDVIDGQLVIVTELADGSFKDRFEECRRAGLPGIPREELVGLLRDAADALDYMSQHHSLQHLDVKPENLLLVGGRAKVGDFGLVKDMQDHSVSLLGGLTPAYAAPELFDGRPTLQSDQYSLAVVYQEMLTGTLPFPGRTLAQLAVQHASSQPRLTGLEPADRETIARALAKKPQDRFLSCRDVADSLAGMYRPKVHAVRGPDGGDSKLFEGGTSPIHGGDTASSVIGEESDATMVLGHGEPAHARPKRTPAQLEAIDFHAVPQIEDLGPLDLAADEHRLRPTLVVGIGGTAARTLRRLRGRLSDRFGDVEKIPAVGMLLLDTDQRDLNDATRGDPRVAFLPEEILAMPLRRPQQYRADAEQHLEWLSRRWLYNIPRSLKTEGLRPLGRLALVDHAEALMTRLRRAVSDVTAAEALPVSAEAAAAPAGEPAPRVYVVASISGGTGSGMVLDVAAMVRRVLADLQLSDQRVLGVLLHSTGCNPQQHDLAMANAHACLGELYQYERSGSHPGQPICNPPAGCGGPATFRHTYLVPLGTGLDEEKFDAATDAVAQYIFLDAVTPAGLFFDACRDATPEANSETERCERLRTFGLAQSGSSQGPLCDAAVEKVCRRVLSRWQGENPESDLESDRAAEQFAAGLKLDLDSLAAEASLAAGDALQQPPEAFFRDLVRKKAASLSPTPAKGRHAAAVEIREAVRPALGELLGPVGAASDDPFAVGSLERALVQSLHETASKRAAAIADWLIRQTEDAAMGAAGARRSARRLVERVRSLEADSRSMLASLREQIAQIEPLFADGARPASKRREPGSEEVVHQYCCLRLSQVVFHQLGKSLRFICQQTVAVEDRLAELGRRLNALADKFPDSALAEDRAGRDETFESGPSEAGLLAARVDLLAAEIDRRIRDEVLAETEGLAGLLDEAGDLAQRLPSALRSAARSAVIKTMREIHTAGALSGGGAKPTGEPEAAMPSLTACGGARRLVFIASQDELARLQAAGAESSLPPASTLVDPRADATVCCEMERLSIRRAAAELIDCRADYADLASRLHTRIDVQWPRLM
jgi:hypothetical protein